MWITNVLAGIAVSKLEDAEIWYDTLLGRAPDTRPMENLVEWKFPKGGWLQLFEDKKRAGHSSITLAETDIEARLKDLKAKGLKIESSASGDKVSVAIIRDPDGNQIVFAQGKDQAHDAVR